jgi:hypothetical protein
MQIRIEILRKGDSVLNVWDNNIAVKRKNGDVEILHYELGEDGLPRVSNNSILITQGDGIVRAKSEDASIEVGTF